MPPLESIHTQYHGCYKGSHSFNLSRISPTLWPKTWLYHFSSQTRLCHLVSEKSCNYFRIDTSRMTTCRILLLWRLRCKETAQTLNDLLDGLCCGESWTVLVMFAVRHHASVLHDSTFMLVCVGSVEFGLFLFLFLFCQYIICIVLNQYLNMRENVFWLLVVSNIVLIVWWSLQNIKVSSFKDCRTSEHSFTFICSANAFVFYLVSKVNIKKYWGEHVAAFKRSS